MTIPYVQSSASQEVPPPYYFPGVTVNAFVWEAQMDRISAYCDRFFNLGSTKERGFVYKPASAWPYAMLMFMQYPMMICSDDKENVGSEVEYSNRGYVSQAEVFVAFPVVRYGATAANLVFGTAMEWALPFIVVGNAMSAVCGREMLGLEKLLADIRMQEGPYPGSFVASIHLPGWPKAGAQQRVTPFLRVSTGPELPTYRGSPAASSIWSLLQSREAGWGIDEVANFANLLGVATAGLAPTGMRTVSLRQIRDARDPGKALYQALMSCVTRYSNVREFRFYNEANVDITFSTAGSFGDILRLFHDVPANTPGMKHAIEPKAAFRFQADIDFGQMLTLHTFPVDRGPRLAPVPASSNLAAPWARPWLGLLRPERR